MITERLIQSDTIPRGRYNATHYAQSSKPDREGKGSFTQGVEMEGKETSAEKGQVESFLNSENPKHIFMNQLWKRIKARSAKDYECKAALMREGQWDKQGCSQRGRKSS